VQGKSSTENLPRCQIAKCSADTALRDIKDGSMSNCVGKKADETKPYFVLITPKLKNKISLKNRLPNEENEKKCNNFWQLHSCAASIKTVVTAYKLN
jgi:hypothetical protein